MRVTLRYNYRLRPGRKALRELELDWNCCRWLWNHAVATKRAGKGWLSDKDLTRLRSELPWLGAGSVVTQQQTLRIFRASRNARSFKSARRDLPSLNYTKRGFSIKDGRLCLPRKTSIPVVWSRELPSSPSSVRVYKDSLGHWYASFVVEREETPLPATGRAVGVDWGVKRVATTSVDGFDLEHPEHGRRAAQRLAKYQRRMARRKPKPGKRASRGYRKAKHAAAKQYRKVARPPPANGFARSSGSLTRLPWRTSNPSSSPAAGWPGRPLTRPLGLPNGS